MKETIPHVVTVVALGLNVLLPRASGAEPKPLAKNEAVQPCNYWFQWVNRGLKNE